MHHLKVLLATLCVPSVGDEGGAFFAEVDFVGS